MKKTNRIMSMLLAVIMAMCMLPVSVFAADAATIVVNSEVIRYEESKAQVSFYPTSYDSQSDWQYYYIVSQQDTEKTADDVKNGGTATDFDENSGVATFDVTNLAEGVKYIHIVLVQKNDPTQVSNVLKLTIPEYVPLTIVPSADGYELESNNTLTIVAGTTVTFTTSESGCGMDYKEGSKVGPDLEFVGDEGYIRTATFSEIGTYTIEASINYKTAECSVIVVDELHQHYTLTFDYSIPNENEIEIGAGITDKTADFEYGTVVDLSEYWPSELTDKVEETTYYFAGFTKKDDIKILDSVAVDSNIVLEAAWVTQEKITITFETQGGDLFGGTRKSRVNKGCDFGTLNGFHIPTREDYVFTGWCLKNIGLPEDDLTELTEDTTVYAIWKWNRQPGSAWWSTNVKGKAEWTPVDGIDGYIVTLYEAQSEMGIDSKKVSADVTNYTFNNLVIFDETKSFYFTVQACLESLKSNETKSDESKPFTIASIDGAIDSAVKVIEADGEISVPVKVINQGGSRVALTDDVFAFIGKKIDVPVANADKLAISKTAIKANLGISGEDAEITLDDAKIILADWREIVNTAEGEEQIKSLLPNYSIYELALLIQANNIIGPDDDTEEKLNRLINDERERQKEAAANTQISFSETKVAMDAEALLSIEKNLADGEYVAISAEKIDVTGLADDEVLFDSGILIGGAGIFTEQELLDLNVIDENDDDITWNELKYLYHYMTITDMKSLGWLIEDFLYDHIDPQVLVWLDEMIERDTIKPLNMQELMDMADLTDDQFELLADADLNDPPIGHLRQAGLTVEQLRRLYGEVEILIGNLNDNDKLSKCNELLDWLDDAIAAKEWEADKSQTQPTWAYTAKEIFIGGVNINFDAVKVNGTTGAVSESRSITASGELAYTIPVNSNFDLSKGTVRAYKVADDGSLSLRKVVVNTDGTVTIQSDSNSTYIVTFEPAKADVDDTPTTPEVPSSPQTGDNSHMWLWFGLLFVSGIGLVGTTIYSRKRRTN